MFARTDRLMLRPGWADDAPALHAAMSDADVVRGLASVPWPFAPADAAAELALEPPAGSASFLLFRRTSATPQLVGGAGIERTDAGHGAAALGYWIARQFWGLGYASEAVAAVIALARDSLRLERLHAGHFIDNPASGRVLEKAGFAASGLGEQFSRGRGHAAPCRLYTLDLGSDRCERGAGAATALPAAA